MRIVRLASLDQARKKVLACRSAGYPLAFFHRFPVREDPRDCDPFIICLDPYTDLYLKSDDDHSS